MADHARITGGPADGLATSPGARFVWLEVVVRKRAERTPTAGLYQRRDGAYEYVGAGGHVCACGAVLRDGDCVLCGAAAAARTQPHG